MNGFGELSVPIMESTFNEITALPRNRRLEKVRCEFVLEIVWYFVSFSEGQTR